MGIYYMDKNEEEIFLMLIENPINGKSESFFSVKKGQNNDQLLVVFSICWSVKRLIQAMPNLSFNIPK
tara:strand:+ start:321331 stop:321534 length:204 start_codon:yes stop_codon:yes gene_type:complete